MPYFLEKAVNIASTSGLASCSCGSAQTPCDLLLC